LFDITEAINFLAEFIKPGSAILGLLVVVKFLHTVMDSSRVYKIKQLELLHSCLKEAESGGKAYTIEKLLENTYKVHIPYKQAMALMEHTQRHKLFGLYKSSYKYLDFDLDIFSLPTKYRSKKSISYEKHRLQAVNTIKYFISAFIAAIVFIVGYQQFILPGLMNIQYGTFNIVWFATCAVISVVLSKIAFSSLVDETSISNAKEFVDLFQSNSHKKSPVWFC
jgi:hypothetical protein